jgi:hypothetical protein
VQTGGAARGGREKWRGVDFNSRVPGCHTVPGAHFFPFPPARAPQRAPGLGRAKMVRPFRPPCSQAPHTFTRMSPIPTQHTGTYFPFSFLCPLLLSFSRPGALTTGGASAAATAWRMRSRRAGRSAATTARAAARTCWPRTWSSESVHFCPRAPVRSSGNFQGRPTRLAKAPPARRPASARGGQGLPHAELWGPGRPPISSQRAPFNALSHSRAHFHTRPSPPAQRLQGDGCAGRVRRGCAGRQGLRAAGLRRHAGGGGGHGGPRPAGGPSGRAPRRCGRERRGGGCVRPSVRLASRPPHHLSPPASPHPLHLHVSPPSFAAESDGVGFREQRRRRREMEDAAAGGAGAEGGAGDEEPFKLETFQVPLREWVGQEQTRAEIKRRFKLFLQTFVNASGTKVRRDDGREGGGEEGRWGVPRAAPPRNTNPPPSPLPPSSPFSLRARRCTRR